MYHENKNNLLELFYNDGNERDIRLIRKHVTNCKDCSSYLSRLENTTKYLEAIPDEKPNAKIFDKILAETADSAPVFERKKTKLSLMPVLQIVLGFAFVLLIVHVVNSQISVMPLWESIKDYWLIKSIGSIGISVLLVLLVGTFITFSLAPILLFESEKEKSFT